jgi:hypothetical protein
MRGGRGRRREELRDDLKEKREYRKFKEEALDRALRGAAFGKAVDLA